MTQTLSFISRLYPSFIYSWQRQRHVTEQTYLAELSSQVAISESGKFLEVVTEFGPTVGILHAFLFYLDKNFRFYRTFFPTQTGIFIYMCSSYTYIQK